MSDCWKTPYDSCGEATAAMRAIKRRNTARGRKSPTGAYFGPTCKRWHLTSKSATRTPPWAKSLNRRERISRSRAS